MLKKYQHTRTAAYIFFASVIALCIIGTIFIYSASSVFALQRFGSPLYYVKRHILGLLLGIIAFASMRCIPIQTIRRIAPLVFVGALLLTLGTLIPGLSVNVHGSSRWLHIGFATIQPSEFLKYSFVLYLAHFFSRKNFNNDNALSNIYAPFLIVLAITSIILLAQPDFGSAVTLCITGMIMAFIAGVPIKYLLLTYASALPIVLGLIIHKPYRLKRILTFLNPWADPQGAGFQIIQSFIAIGSGNMFGLGIGQSKQKFFYLPMQHTDFIFSIIAEETGFIGTICVVLLFSLLLYSGLRLAMEQEDSFKRYSISGLVILLSLQAIINISVATGLVPTKGIGLPFISYGNSALISIMATLGLICNMSQSD